MTPRVTVLMTVYNGLPYLPQAVESVLAQTFGDFEFLIIEDASTDGSLAYLQGLRDPRIRLVVNGRNQGQAASLQEGLAVARAPLIARLDQDDVCLPQRLQQQVALLERRPEVAAVGTWLYAIDSTGRRRGVIGMRIDDYGAFLGTLLTFATPVVHPTVLYRREAVQAAGGYDEASAPCEDYALWCRLALRRQTAVTIPRPLMMVRAHAQQQSRTYAALQQAKALQAHEELVTACRGAAGGIVTTLLRLDGAFWAACPSRLEVRAAIGELDALLARVRQQLELSRREAAQLERRIGWWLGRGATLALFEGRSQTAPVYRRALRSGIRMLRYPVVAAYPAGWLLSPLWRFEVGRWGVQAARRLGRLRPVARLLVSRPGRRLPASAVLYLSYDGMLEPLGESQVLGYLERLSDRYAVTLLSYEKPADVRDRARLQALARRLRERGIRWVRLRYHRRPSLPATGWDVLRGLAVGLWLCRGRRIAIVHARGYVAAVIAEFLKRLTGTRFLFDMRGFWPEEKVQAGHWRPTSVAYRLAKRWERRFFERADAIVSLTAAGVRGFDTLGYCIPPTTVVRVIPTCADLAKFCPGPKDVALVQRLRLEGATVIGCVGTLSNWYLRQPTLACLAVLARRLPRAKVLFVTREDHAALRRDALAEGLAEAQLAFARAEFSEMPEYLRLLDLAVVFISPTFSKQGSAATKLAELLASGISVVINDGVGDSGELIRASGAGVVLPDVSRQEVEATLEEILRVLRDPLTTQRCRETAERHFDLTEGVLRYAALYGQLSGSAPVPAPAMRAVAAPAPLEAVAEGSGRP